MRCRACHESSLLVSTYRSICGNTCRFFYPWLPVSCGKRVVPAPSSIPQKHESTHGYSSITSQPVGQELQVTKLMIYVYLVLYITYSVIIGTDEAIRLERDILQVRGCALQLAGTKPQSCSTRMRSSYARFPSCSHS